MHGGRRMGGPVRARAVRRLVRQLPRAARRRRLLGRHVLHHGVRPGSALLLRGVDLGVRRARGEVLPRPVRRASQRQLPHRACQPGLQRRGMLLGRVCIRPRMLLGHVGRRVRISGRGVLQGRKPGGVRPAWAGIVHRAARLAGLRVRRLLQERLRHRPLVLLRELGRGLRPARHRLLLRLQRHLPPGIAART